MVDIYTGIGVLKRVSSLLKGKVNSSRLPIEKSERASTLESGEIDSPVRRKSLHLK